MKKLALFLMAILLVASISSCGTKGFDKESEIAVTTREDGSGTRGAFIELFGVEEKDAIGNKVDKTTEKALESNSTAAVLMTVQGNEYAIGYISLGSLNDTVKAVQIEGADATVANIKSNTYPVHRPFNIVTTETVTDVTQDFIDFIVSSDGQKVVTDSGYIALDTTTAYTSKSLTGKVIVAGSSSVTPVMEKLKEAYIALNPNVQIELNQSDSSTGVMAAIEGIADIGMASRDIKDTELAQGVTPTKIAIDGIAVIVNKENEVTNFTKEQVKKIFIGETTKWSKVIE